ncbi:shikimate dehydrogenase [Parvibaculaceae bacterium PLY_AMNH_Bact1]|nr:shikimate dehydrogenase [Parvibaculaceae bacterium PLY_AMNH_Bact1]
MTKLSRVWVLGWPVTHSRSPLIHNHWIKKLGIKNSVYEKHGVPPEKLNATLSSLREQGVIGANVTVPHKEAVFAALTHHDEAARRLKAVNTIVDCGTHFEGRNTDGYGFMANLKVGAPNIDFTSKPAMVLGAGGAARAILVALADAGVPEIRLVNRTVEKAAALLTELNVKGDALSWDDAPDALQEAGLLVNTSSLGMTGMDPLDLSLEKLEPSALVTDIVYSPLETDLLARARTRGNATVDGLGMLLHQAVPGFEAWFGVRPEVTPELRALILEDLNSDDGGEN